MPDPIASGSAPSPLPGLDRAGGQPIAPTQSEPARAEPQAQRVEETAPSESEQRERRAEAGDTRGQNLDVTA